MTPNKPRRSPEPLCNQRYERRFFFKSALASGIALAAAPHVFPNKSAETPYCGTASFIDALVFQLIRISELRSKILFSFLAALEDKLEACRRDFFSLKNLVDELENEICKSKASEVTQLVNEVIDLGR